MKTTLMDFGLMESLVDEIINIFDTYTRTLKRYSKPKGAIAYQDNIKEIELFAKKLRNRLGKISVFEQRLLDRYASPDIWTLKIGLGRLIMSCQEAKKNKTHFSKRDPFILDLTISLWMLLENHGISVKIYKNNMLCKVLNVLLPESEKPRKHFKPDSEAPDDAWALNLVREAKKHLPKI